MQHRTQRVRRGFAVAILLAMLACAPPARWRSPEPSPEGIVFRYRAPSASLVQIAGSWASNFRLRGRDWTRDTRVGLMRDDDGDGVWEISIPLEPGRYEYQFLIDGRFWDNDPANPQRTLDARGGQVSLLVVP